MVTCKNCECENQDDNQFCTNCGKKLISKIECKKCAFQNERTYNYCINCGNNIANYEVTKRELINKITFYYTLVFTLLYSIIINIESYNKLANIGSPVGMMVGAITGTFIFITLCTMVVSSIISIYTLFVRNRKYHINKIVYIVTLIIVLIINLTY